MLLVIRCNQPFFVGGQRGGEGVKADGARGREQEDTPGIGNRARDLAFIVSLAGATKPVFEKIV